MNEAKSYACARRRLKKKAHEDLQALLVVIGALEDDRIKGKLVKPGRSHTQYSDDKTGDPLDKDIYFVRNKDGYNQFLFFSNAAPYMKIFKIVSLPNGFGKSKTFRDQDGLPLTSTAPDEESSLKCIYDE